MLRATLGFAFAFASAGFAPGWGAPYGYYGDSGYYDPSIVAPDEQPTYRTADYPAAPIATPPPAPNAYLVFNPYSGVPSEQPELLRPGELLVRFSAEENFALAFLAPDLVKAAVQGRLPRGIGVTRLREAPAADSPRWRESSRMEFSGTFKRGCAVSDAG